MRCRHVKILNVVNHPKPNKTSPVLIVLRLRFIEMLLPDVTSRRK